MKIAFIVKQFPLVSETFILNQITGLIELGHEVDIFTIEETPKGVAHSEVAKYHLLRKVNYLGIPNSKIELFNKAVKVILTFFCLHLVRIIKCLNYKKYGSKQAALNNLVKLGYILRGKYDVIHCHFGPVAKEMIFLKDMLPRLKFVVTFHGYDIRLGLKDGSNIYKDVFNKADHIISICGYNSRMLERMGCPQDKILFHPNGIDTDKFKSGVRAQGSACFIITTVARFVEEKNMLFALDVIRALKDAVQYKFKYYIVGDGPLRADAERKIRELDLEDNVILFGALSHQAVVEKLQETDLFFLPSKAEAFPTVLLEAQAMAIPVIAFDVGGIKEAVKDNITGYIISSHDIGRTKAAIINLMENPALCSSLGKEGRRFIQENFDIKRLNKKLVDIYQG